MFCLKGRRREKLSQGQCSWKNLETIANQGKNRANRLDQNTPVHGIRLPKPIIDREKKKYIEIYD